MNDTLKNLGVVVGASLLGPAVLIGGIAGYEVAQADAAVIVAPADEPEKVSGVFSQVSGEERAVSRIVVRGDGCLNAEDSTRLRLVEWQPSRERVVYRCVKH